MGIGGNKATVAMSSSWTRVTRGMHLVGRKHNHPTAHVYISLPKTSWPMAAYSPSLTLWV